MHINCLFFFICVIKGNNFIASGLVPKTKAILLVWGINSFFTFFLIKYLLTINLEDKNCNDKKNKTIIIIIVILECCENLVLLFEYFVVDDSFTNLFLLLEMFRFFLIF